MKLLLYLSFFLLPSLVVAQHVMPSADSLANRQRLDSLVSLCEKFVLDGKEKQALPLSEDLVAFAAQAFGEASVGYALALKARGLCLDRNQRFDEAEQVWLQAKDLLEKNGRAISMEYGWLLIRLGTLMDLRTDHQQEETYLLAAKALYENHLGTNNLDYARNLEMLGGMYNGMGDLVKRDQSLLQARAVYLRFLDKNSPNYRRILNALGAIYHVMDSVAQAEPYFIEAQKILIEQQGKDATGNLFYLSNLGIINFRLGRLPEARAYIEEQARLSELKFGKVSEAYLKACGMLSHICYRMGDLPGALRNFSDARRAWRAVLGENNRLSAVYSQSVAGCFLALNQPDSCLHYAHEATQIVLRLFLQSRDWRSLYEQENSLKMEQDKFDLFATAVLIAKDLHPERVGDLYDQNLAVRNFLLCGRQALERQLAQSADSVHLAGYRQWKQLRQRLGDEYAKPLKQRHADFSSWETQAEDLEKRLARSVAGFAQAQKNATWQQVQATLSSDEAAVEFLRFRQNGDRVGSDSVWYVALVLRPGWQSPRLVRLCNERRLDSLLNLKNPDAVFQQLYAVRSIVPGGSAENATAPGLFASIWQPLDSLLQGVSTVFFSPDGLLHRVAFHAMPTGKPGEVLADRYQLHWLGSTGKLALPLENELPDRLASAVLMGGIRYDFLPKPSPSAAPVVAAPGELLAQAEPRKQNNSFAAFSRGGAAPEYLKGTKDEVVYVEKLMERSAVPVACWLDTAATEDAFKMLGVAAPSPSVLHVATHGFSFPEPSKIQLENQPHLAELEHPLVRSGLLLAGSSHAWTTGQNVPGTEDGILTAYEIAHLDLSHTYLAVLSACGTGLGEIRASEGVFGLQRAFQLAGVRRLIVSLWDVPDVETAAFMARFYEHWLGGGSDVRSAFAKTQAEMRRRYAGEPEKWAGFVLVE